MITFKPGAIIEMDEETMEEVKKGKAVVAEKDPTGRDPKQGGAKLDAGKSPILQGVFQYFPRAIKAVADVSGFGANKYSWGGWGTVPDGINRYGNAMGRHILAESIEGEYDSESGMLHAAQIAWNALARLEYILREKEGRKNG